MIEITNLFPLFLFLQRKSVTQDGTGRIVKVSHFFFFTFLVSPVAHRVLGHFVWLHIANQSVRRRVSRTEVIDR